MRLVNIRPTRRQAVLLGLAPLLLLVLAYLIASASRHAINPADKILPTPAAMVTALVSLVAVPDPLSGELLFWADTAASLSRLGLGISTLSALLVGLVLGLIPGVRATFGPLVTIIAVILPFMSRDIAAHVEALPAEQLVKAQTLGASSWQMALRVALPQAMPRLIQAVRLSLGPAWVFLISPEAIASDVGLGYRIFLVRRYLSTEIILPYVAWITLLAIVMDWALQQVSKRGFA